MTKEPFEMLFRFRYGFIHVQRLVDDFEYDTDYTIYDDSFRDIDGGCFCDNYKHTLEEIAKMVAESDYVHRVDLDKYRGKYDFL